MIRVKKILYPTDFSSYSTAAYFHALGLAEAYRAGLTVCFVHNAAAGGDPQFWRDQLESVRPANPAISVTHVFLEGDPATEITKYAAESGTDVIVLGTHGRTGVERQLMGSVAEKVMREAACSVLVVKLPGGATPHEVAEDAVVTGA